MKAISKYNVAVTDQSGKVGNVRYIQKGGQTYVRSAHNSSVNNPRTNPQMAQRLKFASLAQFYRKFAQLDLLRGAFSTKQRNQSDYNAFMQINKGLGVYFTKDEIAQNACIALPATISRGTLPKIQCVVDGTKFLSSISVPTFTSSATVGAVSQQIITNNTGFKKGDKISLVIALQSTGDVPEVTVCYEQLTLDPSNTTAFAGAFTYLDVIQSKLACTISDDCTVGFVRTSSREISSCTMTNSNGDNIDAYTTDDVFETAANSYGTRTSSVLYGSVVSSGGGDTPTPTPTPTPTSGFVLSVKPSPAYAGSCTGGGTYPSGRTVELTATPAEGFHFDKWSDGNTTNPRNFTVTEDKTLYAIFAAD